MFLYEDPAKYDSDNVLQGFMQGYFLICVSVHHISLIILTPLSVFPSHIHQSAAGIDPLTGPMAIQVRLVKRYKLRKVTVPIIIYTAIQVSRPSIL